MGKKISRGIGYAVCVLLVILCIVLIVTSSLFGARGAVDILGFNVYIAETDEFEAVSEGSAVMVRRCEAYELERDHLVLYSRGGKPALGYMDSAEMKDGVYTVTVSDSEGQYSFEETDLIGKADMSSSILGAIIRFSQTGWGICVIAVLPCLALIIFDIIRAAAAKLPPPEVVPKVKNEHGREDTETQSAISVKPDGRGAISRKGASKPASGADGVLFSYSGRQQAPARGGSNPDIIPLSKPIVPPQKTTEQLLEKFAERRAGKPETVPERRVTAPVPPSEELPRREERRVIPDIPDKPNKPDTPVPVKTAAVVGTPAPVAARRYLDNAVEPPKVSGATAEIPELPKKSKNDAFFAQSDVPQIGRKTHRGAIKPDSEYSGRRSSVILAQKSRSELISDDDDTLDKGRYEVDDILAGLDRRKKK
ncbi:MAG: hypothetical protein K2O14_06840 [Oscillospiraceae bacterium]|nr:hypothetical protein [Oscillospiraceae bacterium]